MKPYNSFCVDTLFIGYEEGARREDISPEQKHYKGVYLGHHGMDEDGLSNLVRGKSVPRKFIPLPAQVTLAFSNCSLYLILLFPPRLSREPSSD